MRVRTLVLGLVAAAVLPGLVLAQSDAPSQSEQGMPPMGPPEEMKECAWLVGDWTADMKMRMAADSPWVATRGSAHYETVLDGGALLMTFEIPPSAEMPMRFRGMGLQTWDRETNQWQMTWTDNMTCRTTIYTGPRTEGQTVMTGEDLWNGMKMLSRITASDETPTGFDWLMETSLDGGKSWYASGQAKYTRVK